MAEKLSENYRDRIKSYLEAHSELQESQGSEDLPLTDPEKFESSLVDGVKGSLDKFLAVKMPLFLPKGQEKPMVQINSVLLDENIPISMEVYKTAKYEEGKFVCDQLYFKLRKNADWLAEFTLRDYENEFRFSHRKTNARYRRTGISSIAIKAIDEFVKEYVKKHPKRESVIHANTAQLDVISWMQKNGYELTDDAFPNSHGVVRMYNLEEILDSLEQNDGRYTVTPGDFLYVFPGDFEGVHMNSGGIAPNEINMDSAALIHLKKTLNTESGESDEAIQALNDSSLAAVRREMNKN